MIKDLTVGTPYKVILRFTAPALAGNMLQQVYNMADSVIIGRFVGEDALAGVGVVGSLNFLIIGFIIGMCAGFCIPISQAFGAKNYAQIQKFYGNALVLTAIISVIITTLSLVFLQDILYLINTPSEVMQYTYSYASTMFMGLSGIFLYNLMASIMRALGDSKTPLYFLIFSSLLNVVLSLCFVIFFNMGVFGTGLATAISQTVSGILCLITIRKKFDILRIGKSELVLKSDTVGALLKMGVPMGLQISITAIGSITLQSAINTLGSLYVLSTSTGMKVSGLFMQGLDTLGLAVASYTGQNIGASNLKRVKKGVFQSIIIGTVYSAISFIVILLIGGHAASLFVSNPSAELSTATYHYLIGNSVFYIILCVLLVLRSTIQGLGYSSLSMISGTVEMITRVSVSFGLVGIFGYNIILVANPLAWISAVLVLVPMYLIIIKKLRREIA